MLVLRKIVDLGLAVLLVHFFQDGQRRLVPTSFFFVVVFVSDFVKFVTCCISLFYDG